MNALKLFVFFSVVMAGLAFADERTLTPEQMEALAKGGELDNPLSPPFHPPFTPLSPPPLRSKGGFKALPPKANS